MNPEPFDFSGPQTHFLHLQFTSAITIAFDTVTLITWNKIVETIGGFSLSAIGTKIIVPKTGIYSIVYTGQWDNSIVGIRLNQLVSANLGVLLAARINGTAADFPSWFLPFMVKLKAGDVLWGNAYHSGPAGGLAIIGTDSAANGFVIKLLEEI